MRPRALAFGIAVTAWIAPAPAAQELPFDTSNQSPLVQIYGLPGIGAPRVLAPGRLRADLHYEAANHFVGKSRGSEELFLDGETHRSTLKVYRGLRGSREIGIEIPYVDHNEGFLDSFIEGWHDFFGLPQNGREQMPANQFLLRYRRDGVDRINLTQPTAGLGDVRLVAGQSLGGTTEAMLRLSVKLPTGDSAKLLGSGATDAALWLSIACPQTKCADSVSWYGGGGLLRMAKGDVLPELQRQWVVFGSAGLHWKALPRLTLAAQLDAHTPFYDGSELKPLAEHSAQLVLGGIWRVHERHAIELTVAEDVAVDTAPDVVVRVGLRSWF